MIWLVLVPAIIFALFSFVILFGAPYLPTLKRQQEEALDLLDLKPGQTLLELGSGDGRMLVAAAKRGIKGIGIELNPLLVIYSWLITRRYRGLVSVKWRNFWSGQMPECDGIYVFLLDAYMAKLDNKITQEIHKPVKIVSYAFKLPGRRTATDKNGLHLYKIKP